MNDITFDRDEALRGYWIYGLKDLQQETKNNKAIFLPDALLKKLFQSHYPHRTSWEEWRDWEASEHIRLEKQDEEVKWFKEHLDPARSPILDIADLIAKSEQLAEQQLESR